MIQLLAMMEKWEEALPMISQLLTRSAVDIEKLEEEAANAVSFQRKPMGKALKCMI